MTNALPAPAGPGASCEPPPPSAGDPGDRLVDFDVMSPRCPSRTVLRHVVDRWTPLVVESLRDGPARFTEIRRRIGGVTPKVLTQTLRSMERDGLLTRTEHGGVPPRVDYDLTSLGRSLSEPMSQLRHWAQEHAAQVLASRRAYDLRHGVPPQADPAHR